MMMMMMVVVMVMMTGIDRIMMALAALTGTRMVADGHGDDDDMDYHQMAMTLLTST
jgi:hypothetical protein